MVCFAFGSSAISSLPMVLHVSIVNSVLSELLFVARKAETGDVGSEYPKEIFVRHVAVWARLCRVADYFASCGVTSLTYLHVFVLCCASSQSLY